jgi:hypothetical protein
MRSTYARQRFFAQPVANAAPPNGSACNGATSFLATSGLERWYVGVACELSLTGANPKFRKSRSKSLYISTFSYFGLGPVGHHEHDGSPDSLGTLTYKVTSNLAELGITSADDVLVRFVPTNLMVGTKLKAQKAGTGVVVSNIRLETTPAQPQ